MRRQLVALVCGLLTGALLSLVSTASSASPEPGERVTPAKAGVTPAVSGSDIATLALANVGQGACTTNTLGGTAFESSCTGNGGQPEYWCADFAIWVWASAGVTNLSQLTAAAGSFYVYGQTNNTLSDTPAVGDAAVFDYQGGGVADHVAIVTQVNADGTIETVSGDWNGQSGSEAEFASTSSVVLNSPAYAGTVGTAPAVMGMTISGFVAPAGVGAGAPYAAQYVSQSFPLASTALTMVAGQTIPSYIEMQNTGANAWDTSTHLGTSQPRDRASVFADSTWIAPNRPAGVSGSVPVGGTYKFTFDLHAPSTPGTYFEYFNLVEDGVAWFSDPGQGGPADDDLEVQIVVTAAPDAGSATDSGTPGDTTGDAGSRDAAAPGATEDAAPGATGDLGAPGAGNANPTDPASPAQGGANESDASGTGSSGGCSLAPESMRGDGLGWAQGIGALAALAWLMRRALASRRRLA